MDRILEELATEEMIKLASSCSPLFFFFPSDKAFPFKVL